MGLLITPNEMKQFIIETLDLEDLTPEEIGDEQPLFVEGLGLDSIDALELGMALRKRFHIPAAERDPATKDDFRDVMSLVNFVVRHGQAPLRVGA
ncbi:MAG: phosphopantetheine-binding protein [Holophaga sp.]|nr:phosphopantetheine-binding protein [Holophaga sp.]